MILNNNFTSQNYSAPREKNIEYIILHYTGVDFHTALQILTTPEKEVSAHYLIKDDGEIFQLVKDSNVAWHAGKSFWKGQERLNQSSIGIELDNFGDHVFTAPQMKSLISLVTHLMNLYSIPPQNVIGHSDVAPNRKIDPGIFLDWHMLSKNNIAIWHDVDDLALPHANTVDIDIMSLQSRLRSFGYNIELNGVFDKQTNYVIRAFQSRFCPDIIKSRGIEFYQDNDSVYSWDKYSDAALESLLRKLAYY